MGSGLEPIFWILMISPVVLSLIVIYQIGGLHARLSRVEDRLDSLDRINTRIEMMIACQKYGNKN
jgi:hypothetical protein